MSPSYKLLAVLLPALAVACTGPPINQNGLNLIKSFESYEPEVYDDGFGNPTIGYGHLCGDATCSEVTYPKPLSEPDASRLLADDLVIYQDALTNALADPVTLNDNQYAALVSWTYNIGQGNMQNSDLIARLNKGEKLGVVVHDELPQWRLANGQVVEGLVRRRRAELKLFDAPAIFGALPVPC
ncbi:lysozyme-like domain-containing protein [Aspergillus pseudotamarii]|uniref:Lysozyme-like domain-containing protein n=1 Tax=Aspergillus pseudotamarii TaxID=132259 RepID=A0A5N6SZN4_ASPPS|nr:lysozyme-like domain-containing protein [Aspergillus pseudotamarii]KAE8140146.1 lysozyme-like domain-containing protein [Aspergillus pseudotamarii]